MRNKSIILGSAWRMKGLHGLCASFGSQEGLLATTGNKWGLKRHVMWTQTSPSAQYNLLYELLQDHYPLMMYEIQSIIHGKSMDMMIITGRFKQIPLKGKLGNTMC